MNRFLFRIFFAVVFIIRVSEISAQNYPVQAFVNLSPPYRGYLPDYADVFNNQLRILLTFNDFTLSSYNVKLKISIEGNGFTIQTNPNSFQPVIVLNPGIPVEISGAELRPYLQTSNLIFSGINVAQYEQSKILPEGQYTICVDVIDYFNPNEILTGNHACASGWFSLQEPPLLNLPVCGQSLPKTDPQFLQFNWTPLHTSSPNSIMNTEYIFELFEVRPAGMNPDVIVRNTIPIYTMYTQQTSVVYGISEPVLMQGLQYAWRVRVRDLSGRDEFRNNGYSSVCTFVYGDIGSTLLSNISLNLQSNGTGARQGTAWWNGSGSFTSYILEVRKAGNNQYQWFPYTTSSSTIKINSLEPSTQYQCRLKGINGNYESEWSNISSFTTLANPSYACNSTAMPARQQNFQPLLTAYPGMIFSTGQFEMIVTTIYTGHSVGRYTGFGKIYIPFAMMNVNVTFKNILVDENMVVRDGKIEVVTEGMDSWIASFINPGEIEMDYYYPNNVDSIYVDQSGNIIIIDDGNLVTIENSNSGNFYLQDGDGTIYIIQPDGAITRIEPTLDIVLSEAHNNVITRSLEMIVEEYNGSFIQQLTTTRNNNVPGNITGNESPESFIIEYLGELDETTVAGVPVTSNNQYFISENELLRAKVNRKFALVLLDSRNYYLIVTYVKPDQSEITTFIDQHLVSGKSIDETAELLKPFITAVIGSSVKKVVYD